MGFDEGGDSVNYTPLRLVRSLFTDSVSYSVEKLIWFSVRNSVWGSVSAWIWDWTWGDEDGI